MDWDDAAPKPKLTAAVGDNLATLSVNELEARIQLFDGEIERVRAELAKKRAQQAAASAFFKS